MMMPTLPTHTQVLLAHEFARHLAIPDETPRSPSDRHNPVPDPLWLAVRHAIGRLGATLRREPA